MNPNGMFESVLELDQPASLPVPRKPENAPPRLPFISWHFKLFGPYIGSDIIGLTEIAAAMLIIAGYVRPQAGIVGGLVLSPGGPVADSFA